MKCKTLPSGIHIPGSRIKWSRPKSERSIQERSGLNPDILNLSTTLELLSQGLTTENQPAEEMVCIVDKSTGGNDQDENE